MYSLAVVYAAQGRHGEAQNILVRVLAARERTFGLSHPDTQKTVKQLAQAYEELGQLEDATMLKPRIMPPTSGLVCIASFFLINVLTVSLQEFQRIIP
jgi:hypothetical protein